MIKKSLFEDELMAGMIRKLASQDADQGMNSLSKAAEHLSSAVEILEELGMRKKADLVLEILVKIATNEDVNLAKHNQPKRPADPRKVPDRYTKGLTPDKMVKNLLEHGTVFPKYDADDGLNADDTSQSDDALLDIEIDNNNLEVSEADGAVDYNSSFEDER